MSSRARIGKVVGGSAANTSLTYFNHLALASPVAANCSILELSALELSLEVYLAEVRVVGLLGSIQSLEVEEGSASEVNLAWVINEHGHNEFLSTASAGHLV